jgi:hypothetical protein
MGPDSDPERPYTVGRLEVGPGQPPSEEVVNRCVCVLVFWDGDVRVCTYVHARANVGVRVRACRLFCKSSQNVPPRACLCPCPLFLLRAYALLRAYGHISGHRRVWIHQSAEASEGPKGCQVQQPAKQQVMCCML